MGMFDEVRSSFQLPEPFMGLNQTKDMDDFGGAMRFYHVDSKGYLWCGDYKETNTFEVIGEDDPRYDPERNFLNYEFVPTGKRGKWQVYPVTRYVTIYPTQWGGSWETWPRLRLHFKSGKLQDFQEVTGR